MRIILPALGVAFAAFCVWLAVRIVNRRERWAMWTAAGLVIMLVVYPLSIGPVCWILAYDKRDVLAPRIYRPIGWIAATMPDAYLPIGRYLRWWLPNAGIIKVPVGQVSKVYYLVSAW